jgi:hypothetical protein
VRGRVQLFVAQKGLDDPDAGADLEQVGGKAVAERVEGDGFADAGRFDRLLEQAREFVVCSDCLTADLETAGAPFSAHPHRILSGA